MSYIPMHNRLAEGFVEPDPSGDTLDPLSSRILPRRLAGSDFVEALQRTRRERDMALGAALIGVGRFFGVVIARPARSLIERFATWRRRQRAAVELYAVDARTLADLGLRRADIAFIVAQGCWERRDACTDVIDPSRFPESGHPDLHAS